jgi:hypothetical protein
MATVGSQVIQEVKSTSMNAVVAGFAFAAALAWLDVVRWMVTNFIDLPKTSGGYYALSALLTTLLAVLVYMIFSKISTGVQKPQTVYAVTAGAAGL